MSSEPDSASEEQARYFAEQLDQWADQLEAELSGRTAVPAPVQHAKRRELYDIQRQIKALRDRFPEAFDSRRR
jgi:type VI protein secretion system component VasK